MDLNKVIALVPITHDGKPYAVGDELDLDDAALAPLLAVNAVVLVEDPATPAKATRSKAAN